MSNKTTSEYEEQNIAHHCIKKQYAKELDDEHGYTAEQLEELNQMASEQEWEKQRAKREYTPSYSDCYPDPWADDYAAIINGEL